MRTRPRQAFTAAIAIAALSAVIAQSSASALGAPRPSGLRAAQPVWKNVFYDDFTTSVPLGTWPGPDASRWSSYASGRDTSGNGLYDPTDVVSVHDGYLDLWMHTSATGQPLSAAPIPLINGKTLELLYGRYTVRFNAPSIPGYKAAWLLWPADNVWDEGEIDFPEGGFNDTIGAYDHLIGDPSQNAYADNTGVPFPSGWHTASVEWTPKGVTYSLDGTVVGSSLESPRTLMRFVLQTETDPVAPTISDQGHVLVDWVSIDRYNG